MAQTPLQRNVLNFMWFILVMLMIIGLLTDYIIFVLLAVVIGVLCEYAAR